MRKDLDDNMEFQELAAIYEFSDGYDQETAERMAREHIKKRMAFKKVLEAMKRADVNSTPD